MDVNLDKFVFTGKKKDNEVNLLNTEIIIH